MGMFGPEMGAWVVCSESDPRWNKTGKGEGYGVFIPEVRLPKEMWDWIDLCRSKYGASPEDTEISFTKY